MKAFATSTLCTAIFPALGLELPAGVRTEIDPKHIPALSAVEGVEVTTEPTARDKE